MSVSRIKSIIIAILVIVNLLFLTFLIADKLSDSRARGEELQRVTELYADRGVTLSPELKLSEPPAGRAGPRSTKAEEELARRLLGDVRVSDQGGSIYLYTSEAGSALFRSGGEFEIELEDGAWAGECTAASVRKLLKQLGLTAEEAIVSGETAKTVQTCQKRPIFNCELELTYASGSLRHISGRLAADPGSEEGAEGISCVSALMRFLSLVTSGEVSCTDVYAITPGYVLNTSIFGAMALEPAWRIETDAGDFQLSAVTGQRLA